MLGRFWKRSQPVTTPGPAGAVSLHELLGRTPVDLDTPEIQRFIAGKRVMVTGAGGSIGSEICRQIMKFCPAKLLLVERAENNLFEIDRELRQRWIGSEIRPYLADITDPVRVDGIFDTERPHVVFHCAAHKHVPMMELNPAEAVKNNVFGTQVIADASLAFGAQAFVMVSSDKAVNPTSVMGATKRVAEIYVQSLSENLHLAPSPGTPGEGWGEGDFARRRPLAIRNHPHPNPLPAYRERGPEKHSTRFVAVRFGNVLGSSGSVVPIFQKQIDAGGPVTVTHADMKRYFMTIPEASQLVMQAGAIGKGGEIFVLDMGEPVKIIDLARELIRRRGLREEIDIELKITGIRPGEKLYEELSCENEQIRPTAHDKIHVWELSRSTPTQVKAWMDDLADVCASSRDDVVAALMRVVPEFTPDAPPAVRTMRAA